MQALVVVLLGDSVTEVSACAFHRRFADTYTLTVSGTGGARADQRERDAAVLALERPDRVIINLGTNDVFQGTPPARTILALTRIATAFRCARRIHLVTVTEGVFADGSPVLRARSVALNQRIATLAAAHGWGVIPWHDIVRRYRDAGEPLGSVTSDTIHPSPLGQWLLADTYARALAPCTRADPVPRSATRAAQTAKGPCCTEKVGDSVR